MRTTSIRFTGLASGLDTESIVNSMVMPYKMKVDTAKQNQTMMEWKKDAWRDMNKKLFNFYDQQLTKLRLESTYNKRNISVSNSNAIEIRPNSTLPEGTHKIDYIKNLAESTKVATDKLKVSGGGKITLSTKLSHLVDANGKQILGEKDKFSIKVSDTVDAQGNPIYKEVQLSGDMTIKEMQNTLKTALPNTNVSFDEGAEAFFISGKKTGANQQLSFTGGMDGADAQKAFQLLGVKQAANQTDGLVGGNKTIISQITFEETVKAPATTKLSDLNIVIEEGDKLQLMINGEPIEVPLTREMTLSGLEEAVNKKIEDTDTLKGKASLKYDGTTGEFKVLGENNNEITPVEMKVIDKDNAEKGKIQGPFQVKQNQVATQNTTLKELGLTISEFTIEIKGEKLSVKIDETTTLKQLTEKIGEVTDEVFEFDEKTGRLVVSDNIKFAVNNEELEKLGIHTGQMVFSTQGKDAILSYNGMEITSESNNVSVNGFNFNIKSTVDPKDAITVVSTFDMDTVVDTVKNFVEEYNKLIEDIHTQLGAPSAKSYKPLTDEQKKEMSDYEIEQWEKKIKDSLFRNDSDLEQVVGDMRQVLGGTVAGNAFGSLSGIGIKTGDWKENGKLHFDEEKFRQALTNDADSVIQLLAGSGDSQSLYLEGNPGKTMEDYNKLTDKDKAVWENQTKGFMDRMYDHITQVTKSSELKTAYSFYNDKLQTKEITRQKEEVSKLQNRMYRMEDMYYKRFTAMEKMMSQLNNQSNWLAGQMGGM